MGVKLPPIWRKREKATAEGDWKPQPRLSVVVALRFLIEISQQIIYTFAAVQIVLSFSVGQNIFKNMHEDQKYKDALEACENDIACRMQLQGPCPPGASNHVGGVYSHCADPSYMTPGLSFMEWITLESSSLWLVLILLFSTFLPVSIVFTVMLMCNCGCGATFPTVSGASVAGSPDVAICCAHMRSSLAAPRVPATPSPSPQRAPAPWPQTT